ncbi:MAG: beta-galactosidase [Acidobacteriia bacterium]|nr:beta-galactosidase [Terriglobia bacterium]
MKALCLFLVLVPAVLSAADPVFPYGAVYFRKSNPPPEDWERDHKTAAQQGMNIFRHWMMWSAVEVAPGKYDWSDYDRMMDLEAQNGIKAVLAEMITAAPEWAFQTYKNARFEAHDGHKGYQTMSGSSSTGGFPGLCLDNEEVRTKAGAFLKAMATRYKDHPAMYAYDLWNEGNTSGGGSGYMQTASSAHIPNEHRGASLGRFYCYCPSTAEQFRKWLVNKYGSVEALGKAWHRYSFAEWANVEPPRASGPNPDWLDWLEFREDRAHELLRWRRDTIRSIDKKSKITMHGLAYSVEYLPSVSANDWRAAAEVETYGFTWVHARKGSQPWKQFHAVDMIRAASRGKPFWHAEFQGGPLWMQSEVTGRPLEDARKPDERDLRIWNMISFSGGVSGLLYLRWRPLLDGPLFGAFGPFGMDGSLTPRAEMAGKLARWSNANADLWKSNPVKGDVGIAFVPESERFNFAQQGNTSNYAESARGAYMAFFDSNIQPDWVHIDHIAEYPAVYLPYPVMLSRKTAGQLRAYVENGGFLIRGLPAYFGDAGRVGQKQPNYGLSEVFGTAEADVEFTPDLLEKLTWRLYDVTVGGRFYKQAYQPSTGKAIGWYQDGSVAAVENRFGKGRTVLMGTFPAASYFRNQQAGTRQAFQKLLPQPQRLRVTDASVIARLHEGGGGTVLWVMNPARQAKPVSVQLNAGSWRKATDLWGNVRAEVKGSVLSMTVPERDAAVLRLE